MKNDPPVICWGCECGVELVDGYRREPHEDDARLVYEYPCKATSPARPVEEEEVAG